VGFVFLCRWKMLNPSPSMMKSGMFIGVDVSAIRKISGNLPSGYSRSN